MHCSSACVYVRSARGVLKGNSDQRDEKRGFHGLDSARRWRRDKNVCFFSLPVVLHHRGEQLKAQCQARIANIIVSVATLFVIAFLACIR